MHPRLKLNEDGTLDAKALLVGDSGSAKSDLIFSFHYKMPWGKYTLGPCLGTEPVLEVQQKSGTVNLMTAACSNFDHEGLLSLDYRHTTMIAFVFSLDSPESLLNIETKWLPQSLHYCGNVPFVLVGCNMEARDYPIDRDESKTYVTSEEGIAFAKRIGAWRYAECAACKYRGVEELARCLGAMSWDIYNQQQKKHKVLEFEFSASTPALYGY